jgi:3',5'-cyclic AMP phosphodiesterase CpdA
MKLYALGDLHLRYEVTRRALQALPPHPYDWLILAGDVGETEEHLRFALNILARRFGRLLWVPGNHDLWTIPTKEGDLRGQAKYERLVSVCREYGVLTPEDP